MIISDSLLESLFIWYLNINVKFDIPLLFARTVVEVLGGDCCSRFAVIPRDCLDCVPSVEVVKYMNIWHSLSIIDVRFFTRGYIKSSS